MKTNRKSAEFQPNRVLSYFKAEWRALLIVTVSGLIYNIGLLTGPWFEGTMTGYLVEILNGTGQFSGMLMLVIRFAVVTAVVQISRYVKRFYVRRFANNVNRRMKEILYGSLVKKSRASLREEGEGNIMTKAILDVDDCVEGMRKFTTEIFDTGVALTAYLCMLLWYDWRLTILCMLFPPISYVTAEKMKKVIQKAGAAYKEQSGRLSTATLDRAENAMTYRVFGLEKRRQAVYEENLTSYEKAAVKANIWNAAMPPIYRIISMAGVFFILYFGQKNVLGTGWQAWSIASFTTFLVCFVKLSVKSSSAAKLFNAVHKAQVSWNRIKPLLPQEEGNETDEVKVKKAPVEALKVKHLSLTYPDGKKILDDISFSAKKGQIIGITGAVACGKSTLGKAFLCEYPYEGHITVDGAELQNMEQSVRTGIVGYLGHDPELFNDSVENNVLLGDSKNSDTYLNAACMKQEVAEMTDGKNTLIGSGGAYLSGGQAKRLAFARTLCHDKPILILDDPFSALDKNTEKQAFVNLQALAKDSIVLLISHRLYLFPEMDGVIWMENGKAVGRASGHVPETLHNIRTIHCLGKEKYMEKRYDTYINESYRAMEKTNFYDAVYSPVILITNAVVVAVVMLLSASGNTTVLTLFGMSAGTAVAVINYISQIFTPVESLGMEIQTIQSALAGIHRINEFFALEENPDTVPTHEPKTITARSGSVPFVEFRDVTFGYDKRVVLDHLSFKVMDGDQVTLTGRTGAGKSTIFKLLLGLYKPQSGEVLIHGVPAADIRDDERRRLFGCVEQTFHMVPGTVRDQITLYDSTISDEAAHTAAELTGLKDTIESMEKGYDTRCTDDLFSQGQWQLLSIARAAAAAPSMLLFDEITASLDAETERAVLSALKRVAENRTVISISHRTSAELGRIIALTD